MPQAEWSAARVSGPQRVGRSHSSAGRRTRAAEADAPGQTARFMYGLRKRRRRQMLRAKPFPASWRRTLEGKFPLFTRLPTQDQRELEGHIQVFVAEKRFEGCGGFQITDEVRVLIAAQACLVILHRDTDYFPTLRSILVYPDIYVARTARREEDELIDRKSRSRLGESGKGAVILSWSATLGGAAVPDDGVNLVLHEFAHQLDEENGVVDGAPWLGGGGLRERHFRYLTWARILGAEYARLRHESEAGRETVLDQYGAEHPAEFFAVATECFFEKPRQLQQRHPKLYDELKQFYRQDPVTFASPAGPEGGRLPSLAP